MQDSEKAKTGFALLDKERVREAGRLGGQRAHAGGKAHKFTKEKAAEAARKSALVRKQRREASEEAARPQAP